MENLSDLQGSCVLVWPAEIFLSEGSEILKTSHPAFRDFADLLLREAFSDASLAEAFLAESSEKAWDPIAPDKKFLQTLVTNTNKLTTMKSRRPYWISKQGEQNNPSAGNPRGLRSAWEALVRGFIEQGYLSQIVGEACVDGVDEEEINKRIAACITERIGFSNLWPLPERDSWPMVFTHDDEDVIFALVEVFHDLVARPRSRICHSFSNCGWHHKDQRSGPGQAIYRWKMNELLAQLGYNFRLADNGEDTGRLVQIVVDPRADLVTSALATGDVDIKDTVEHAIALFRKRNASREEKRSACVALAHILEERRKLIKAELLSKDEAQLFQLANGFQIRHQDAKQASNYEDEFIDWIFWNFLAAVELTDRLKSRSLNGE